MPSSLHSHNYQIFRSLLIAAREEAALTQVTVAEKLGKPQSFVSKYERGERRLDFTEFVEIAELMEINVVDFFEKYRTEISRSASSKVRHGRK